MNLNIESPLVDNFLYKLDNELSILANSERKGYIEEFKDHLYSLIQEKIDKGMNKQQAIQSSLNEFPDPKLLAQELIDNNGNTLIEDPTSKIDFFFRYKSALVVMGLAEITLLLVDEKINLYWMVLGLAMIIAGNILTQRHKRWNKDNLKQLLWADAGIWICLPIGLFLFFRRNDIDSFLISYMSILTLLIIVQHFITFRLFKRKNINV